ncbi:MAG: hypothetical protein GH151_02455 [Bacteroidetes bacterium]|nr:hypothetical protein [Bacteroidota bacterium]
MKKIISKIGLAIIIGLLVQGCITTTKVLSRISLDMTKSEVFQKIGEPNSVRGSVKNKHGVVIEVWEYRLCSHATLGPRYPSGVHAIHYHYDLYWLYFADNKLVRWGKAGDWRKAADKINEIRFR